MKRRRLAPEELDLWKKVTDRTERLGDLPRFDPDTQLPAPAPPAVKKARAVVLGKPQPKVRPTRHDIAPALPDQLRAAPVQMDRKAFAKMSRGKLKPEGRIDLHGMTLDRAHPALTRFIMSSHSKGRRLVLVITGKGKDRDDGGPIPTRLGVLRHQVPQWLAMAPLKSIVLQVTPAHVSHGGGGAYYVYLRRTR